MSDRRRLRRTDPDREGPVRDWSNLCQSTAARMAAKPSSNGTGLPLEASELTPETSTVQSAYASAAAVPEPIDDEARAGIESAYRVVDEHLQEGRRAAEALSSRTSATASGAFTMSTAGPAGVALAAESIQEMVTQGIRFYSSLAPLWASVVNSIANATNAANPAPAVAPVAAPLSPAPLARSPSVTVAAPFTIELASARMTRVTIDLFPHAKATRFVTSGLHAIDADRPPLTDITFIVDSHSRLVVRIRVPDDQPAAVYNGVIADVDSGDPCGTITLRIEA
jgi:hypothetical protein